MTVGILDPTAGAARRVAPHETTAPRAAALGGLRVGLLENKKRNAAQILDAVGVALESDDEVGLVRFTKQDFAMPLPEAVLEEIEGGCDVVVIGVGDCGSCSASAIADGIILEARGIPSAVIVTQEFLVTAQAMARIQGHPDFPFLLMPHPIGNLTADDIVRRGAELGPRVRDRLTLSAASVPADATA